MNMKLFLKIQGILFIIIGVCLILMVPKFFPLYGLDLNLAGAMFGRWSGAAFLGIGMISYSVSRQQITESFKGVIDGLFVCNVMGLGATVFGQMQGDPNVTGWMAVIFWLAVTLGLAYFRFLKRGNP